MSWQGTYNTFAIERVVYGRPAAEVVKDEVERIGAGVPHGQPYIAVPNEPDSTAD